MSYGRKATLGGRGEEWVLRRELWLIDEYDEGLDILKATNYLAVKEGG